MLSIQHFKSREALNLQRGRFDTNPTILLSSCCVPVCQPPSRLLGRAGLAQSRPIPPHFLAPLPLSLGRAHPQL